LDTTFFFSSGSEANDFAVNLARTYTKSNVVLALRNAYHGTAGQSYQLTNLLTWNTSLPKQLQLERLTWPNPYRSPIADYEAMLLDAEQQLDSGTNGKVAGLWLEPIMGAGGIVPLPPHYVQRLHALVKRYGGLYISD
jgi:4-aminobutyrate aminotransferase-like enzyme